MYEVNFDGLVGPTHHYSGQAYGNLASMHHAGQRSNPKAAALQGLKKMKRLHDLGLKQAVLPPQERPSIPFLHSIGFRGSDGEILEKAAKEAPELLQAASSAAAMWCANCATVTPSCDSHDGRVHITIASLQSSVHRQIEAGERLRLFKHLFPEFVVHPPLPFPDEGAANHIRFASEYDQEGVHLYVYGRSLSEHPSTRFPARQTREACEAIARRHGSRAVFARQNPKLIDQGVFHNDVIACGNRNTLLYHPEAFESDTLTEIEHFLPLQKIEVEISIERAIETYLFNSQLLTLPDRSQLLLAPEQCRTLDLTWLPFPVEYVSLSESMRGGGGPACLRLAIPLTDQEIASIAAPILLTDSLYQTLTEWVEQHYRDRLHPNDLADSALLDESRTALAALYKILQID